MNLDQQLHDPALENHSRSIDKATKQSGNGFDDLGIIPSLMNGISRLKFETPTPIQKESIPAGIQGHDIIAIAQTGSGKTMAFGIPMLQRLSQMKRGSGLVLVPTRELAVQVEESIQSISRSVNLRSVVLIGGASMNMQRAALKKNPRIIIATPGRLMDHIEKRTVDLRHIEILVLDEADRMLDMGFLPDIKKIMKSIPETRQTMLFSATMPKEIEALAEKLMREPTRVETDRSGATPAEVSQEMFFISKQDKSRLLVVQLKKCSGPVLVFTRTKHMAKKLTAKVNKMGFAVAEIHSNRSQGQRRNALEGFKRGRYKILIATDIAARGIDVKGIALVVNYDLPANPEDYVHRIGRTGRAGKTGHAISFANTDQKGSIRDIERFMKTKMAITTLPVLPSEKMLLLSAEQAGAPGKPPKYEQPSKRKLSIDRSAKRKDARSSNDKKQAVTQPESGRKDFRRKDSKPSESKRKAARRKPSKRADFIPKEADALGSKLTKPSRNDFEKNDSKDSDSKRKTVRPRHTKAVDAPRNKKKKTKNESPFWLNFLKHRPSKKKGSGQGAKPKKKSRRK